MFFKENVDLLQTESLSHLVRTLVIRISRARSRMTTCSIWNPWRDFWADLLGLNVCTKLAIHCLANLYLWRNLEADFINSDFECMRPPRNIIFIFRLARLVLREPDIFLERKYHRWLGAVIICKLKAINFNRFFVQSIPALRRGMSYIISFKLDV